MPDIVESKGWATRFLCRLPPLPKTENQRSAVRPAKDGTSVNPARREQGPHSRRERDMRGLGGPYANATAH